ncbi:hypothetical protein TH53_18940 [Pedobacter lusitanus]|uniref:DUF3823 domain-containing protein n=1 Tax=Pedobacter lusitanus TaxID=1503925 RepID=A0A0D0F2F8_9SPHI|nr:DUF3823 domain-containing protein [Pedobacter lusitanus]KIO75748.1 hypothetical protein TH53_18940 [Pedobacter lusitanus]
MKKLFIGVFLALAVFVSACKKDNYKSPDAELSGNIVDAATGKNVPQQTNVGGGYLQLFQTDYPKPSAIQTALHPDGSYTRGFTFNGNYKVVPTGPFFYLDTINVKVNGTTQMDIRVVPYLTVSCEVLSKTSTSITVRVKVAQPAQNTQKIARILAVAATFNTVDVNNYNSNRGLTNTEALDNQTVVSKDYDYTIAELKPATLYYVRGGGRTINPGNYYNYSPMLTVTTNSQ